MYRVVLRSKHWMEPYSLSLSLFLTKWLLYQNHHDKPYFPLQSPPTNTLLDKVHLKVLITQVPINQQRILPASIENDLRLFLRRFFDDRHNKNSPVLRSQRARTESGNVRPIIDLDTWGSLFLNISRLVSQLRSPSWEVPIHTVS